MCKELSEKLATAGIENEIIPRFVDDITLLPTVTPPGARLLDGKLIHFEEHVELDKEIKSDKRTMDLISTIANEISDGI